MFAVCNVYVICSQCVVCMLCVGALYSAFSSCAVVLVNAMLGLIRTEPFSACVAVLCSADPVLLFVVFCR